MHAMLLSADPLPLRRESDGTIRVGDTRVLLDLIVDAFDGGADAGSIARMYPSLRLGDVYQVLGYVIQHRDEVNAYLAEQARLARESDARWQGQTPDAAARLAELRRRTSVRDAS
jgi:uncharacterized protein (DUF433 family)